MRISDWSSDVCSSDLNPARNRAPPISEVRSAPVPLPTLSPPGQPLLRKAARPAFHKAADKPAPPAGPQPSARTTRQLPQRVKALQTMALGCAPVLLVGWRRSEERRVGKECVSPWKAR